MIFKQYYLDCLAHASYLIGDEQSQTAVVVDPQRDVDLYLADARQAGLQIRHVFLTHFHADFLAGHLELSARAGAEIHLGAQAQADYDFTPMNDGDALTLGAVRLVVLETPGHSPESISILVYNDHVATRRPHAVLTGDTLFIGDVGRPDLRASVGWSAQELAQLLYTSLHEKLLMLPDDTLVYPAHGAGSMCGKHLSEETVSTMAEQRRSNYALQPMDQDAFLQVIMADQPDTPAYFSYDAVLNTKEHATLETVLARSLKPLALDELLHLQAGGGQLVDVRDPAEFARAHLAGGLNIGLGGRYATWAGTLLSQVKPIGVIAEPGREEEAIRRLGRIGFDCVAGYLSEGMRALETRPDLVASTQRMTAAILAEHGAASSPPMILDVRTEREWRSGHIAGSLNIPLHQLPAQIHKVPTPDLVVVYCQSGYRSSVAASLLAQHNIGHVADLIGGIAAWEAAHLPVAQ